MIGFGRRRTRDAPGDRRWEMRRRDKRPPSDWNWDFTNKKPAADFSARALHDFRDDDVPVICPTCQILFRTVKKLQKMRCNRLDNLKLPRG